METLSGAGIPFRLLSASDIGRGRLEACRVLVVPGGWAAHKVRALGETGKRQLAHFLERGGCYLGFCGGAGLALSSPPALFLVPVERMALSERLPSASGHIRVRGAAEHPAWEGMPPEIPVSVWWPSQFRWDPARDAAPLAFYEDPEADFQVADLRVSDLEPDPCWPDLEKAYGINLDPARIKGHPAIIEAKRGMGRLILSYAHLETPKDLWGNRLFFNFLRYLNEKCKLPEAPPEKKSPAEPADFPDERTWDSLSRAREEASALVAFGEALFLWNWRNPWLLHWRRGIRGLEYGMLLVTLSHMAGLRERVRDGTGGGRSASWAAEAKRVEEDTREFCSLARRLLREEKTAARSKVLSKLGGVNERVDALRRVLFGNRMNHGGLCRALFDRIDHMLLNLLRLAGPSS